MPEAAAKPRPAAKKPPMVEEDGDRVEPPPPEALETEAGLSPEEAEQARKDYLLTRFWISARGFWGKNGDRLAWILSIGLLNTASTSGIARSSTPSRSAIPQPCIT